jgi:hypothetical protein
MFGESFRCTKCEFDFTTGWSHHASGAFCVCAGCGAKFLITSSNAWGPGDREPCELRLSGKISTGVFVTVLEKCTISARGTPLYGFDFSAVRCPNCGAAEQFMVTLADGSACPRCKEGRIEYYGSAIY